ncbi:paramyosin-like [Haliotis cracherodii]|uniref:paramyosin-like n=1 Tax=Haliotis cracherodii TaxID=6455 RepID=UPI0039EB26C2
MMEKLGLVFLTVIHITVAFEFQSLGSPTFHPNQFNPPSTVDKEVKKAVSDLKAQGSRLEKQGELISAQAGLLNKLGRHLDQQEKSLKDQDRQQKDQGKHIGRLDQLLSQMHASQQEEKSRLSNIEEKLQQMETKVVTTGKPEVHQHGKVQVGSAVSNNMSEIEREEVVTEQHSGNLTNIDKVGLSFALVMKTVKSSEMEDHCAELVEGGRLLVLDTKQKYEAMQGYLNKNMDEGKEFYIGLRRQHGVKTHHWSNGVEIDDNFWCSGPGYPHRSVCTALKRHRNSIGYCIGTAPCHRGNIICEKPQQ